jgi:hypothetical protein
MEIRPIRFLYIGIGNDRVARTTPRLLADQKGAVALLVFRAIVAGLVKHKAFFEARRDGPGEVGGVNFTFSTFWHSVKKLCYSSGLR